MKDKFNFLITSLDLHIGTGKSPEEAWAAAVNDYAYAYFPAPGDCRTELNRAAERVLVATSASTRMTDAS